MSLFTDELKVKAAELELETANSFKVFPPLKKILLIIFVAGLIPVYFITRFGAQAYWTAQYQKYAIVARPSFTQSKDIPVPTVTVLPTGSETYSAYAFVTNPNLELSVKDAKYRFTFYSATGSEIAANEGKFFLLPNEKKYLVASRVESKQKISRATIAFSNVNWQKKLSIPAVKIVATKPLLYDQFDPPALAVQGSIVNNSAYLLAEVRIVYLLYDAANNLIGVSQREEFTVKAKERRTYNQLWPNLQTTKVAKVDVVAETDVLDPANLSSQSGEIIPNNSASDLSRPVDD